MRVSSADLDSQPILNTFGVCLMLEERRRFNVIPVLIIAYNRPDLFKQLIDSIRGHRPRTVYVSLDGPKDNSSEEMRAIAEMKDSIKYIDWTSDVHIIDHIRNVGIFQAVTESVTRVLKSHESIIVLEDDAEIGPGFFLFMTEALEYFKFDQNVGHVSGYNVVPLVKQENGKSAARFSIYPESIAWGTWARAWSAFEPEISWTRNASLSSLKLVCGSFRGAIKWKILFSDVRSRRLSSWAYRWLASLWRQGQVCISPRVSHVKNNGTVSGSHTKFGPSWRELELAQVAQGNQMLAYTKHDFLADNWLSRHIYRETVSGIMWQVLVSLVLRIRSDRS